MANFRANLYHALAEAFSDPPEWISLPGARWPLSEAAAGLAAASGACRSALNALLDIEAESMLARKMRWAALVKKIDPTQLCLYESVALSGRLLGQATVDVELCYVQAGVETIGTELPDHVSVELAFLEHLSATEPELPGSRQFTFIQNHAGRWLPALGRAVAATGDPVYAPIGQLLANWLEESIQTPSFAIKRNRPRIKHGYPSISTLMTCTLCSFCTRACPEGALSIQEDEHSTRLLFSTALCSGCGKCARFCPSGALQMGDSTAGEGNNSGWSMFESPRVACQSCGEPLISQAELAYVASQLGNPAWLAFCPTCRPGVIRDIL